MTTRKETTHIVLHTAAFSGNAGVEKIRRWHRLRGFSDIGYHYVIRRDGSREVGRPEHLVGAHCRDGGYNHNSIGICFEGHGDYETWTVAQCAALISLVAKLKDQYGIPVERVIGHRESGAIKTCPGNLINMDDARNLLRVALYPPV